MRLTSAKKYSNNANASSKAAAEHNKKIPWPSSHSPSKTSNNFYNSTSPKNNPTILAHTPTLFISSSATAGQRAGRYGLCQFQRTTSRRRSSHLLHRTRRNSMHRCPLRTLHRPTKLPGHLRTSGCLRQPHQGRVLHPHRQLTLSKHQQLLPPRDGLPRYLLRNY